MNKKQKIIIGTPSYDGKIDIIFLDSLLNTLDQLKNQNIDLFPIFICYDSLIQRARNDLFKFAYDSKVDALIFIDSDIGWKPADLLKLINSDKDIIGGTYRKKTDNSELYVVKASNSENNTLNVEIDNTGLMEVAGLGCGFMKISRKAIEDIWNSSKPYVSEKGDSRMVFEVVCEENDLISEDIYFCKKWRNKGNKVYLDTSITCNHSGNKIYQGNFKNWIENFIEATKNQNNIKSESIDKFSNSEKNITDDFKVL